MPFLEALRPFPLINSTLPALRFFEPNMKFLNWVKRYHRHHEIYDVGAGCGHVAHALYERSAVDRVIALDVIHRDKMEYHIQIGDGTIYPYSEGSLVMLARPCHGVFVENVVAQATRCKANYVWYIGLDKNVERDLGDFLPFFNCKLTGIGEDNEKLWQMSVNAQRKKLNAIAQEML